MGANQLMAISYGGVGIYLTLTVICSLMGNRELALMFLVGSVIWLVSATLWHWTR